jgi:cytochrome c556
MSFNRFVSITAGALFVLGFSSRLYAREELTQKRIAFMRETYSDVKAIKRAAEQKDYSTIELKAKDIVGKMDKTLDYFPPDSLSEKSRAKPEIWDKWEEFSKLPVKVKDVANALAKAAAAKDEAAIQTQFNALAAGGNPYIGGACAECHKNFFRSPATTKKAEG